MGNSLTIARVEGFGVNISRAEFEAIKGLAVAAGADTVVGQWLATVQRQVEAASDPGADFDQRYAACLAFSSKDYAPDQADEIAQELAKAERGGALDVRVNVAFGEPVVRPQPVIKNHRPAGWRRPILW